MATEAAAEGLDWLERAALRVDATLQEDRVLEHAAVIRSHLGRQKVRKSYAPRPEPKRNKTHRDFLLQEMTWLAKEFQKERRWKVLQSKKFANLAKKSKMDVVSRVEVRRQQAEKDLRKRARFIAHEVMTWWGKIEKFVLHKRKAIADGQHKKDLDEHLDFLVGQTERYVQTLAESLEGAKDGEDGPRAKKRKEEGAPNGIEAAAGAPEGGVDQMFADEPEDLEYQPSDEERDDEGTFAAEEALAMQEGGQRERERHELAGLGADMDVPVEELVRQYQRQAGSWGAGQSSAAAAQPDLEAVFADEPEDLEYQPSDEERDDEGTFAAEEALAMQEGGQQEREKHELAGLGADMAVPVEELVQRYTMQVEDKDKEGKLEYSTEEPIPNLKSGRKRAIQSAITVPFLLKHELRPYQKTGLEWLATLGYKGVNCILADEMGLGKTIQTISLLAHWAAAKGQWGPHLIVVPTSVMLNWEMEFKKWCPAFKVLTYYGNSRERQAKRQGWSKPNSFHVCITSYTLILSDAKMFRRKQWNFMILDEAHMIKNWQSQRWQTLLNFHSQHRVLLTGTPLQNNLMELWSLMHFLMPHIFQSHDDFKQWFSNPMTGMVEGQNKVNKHIVRRLHGILRPFILRRLKSEVEKQMPKKYEHLVKCKLSRRQRKLYEDYMSSSETRNTLASGNYFGVFGVLMALRKVCNHPDLFEGRAIVSSMVPETVRFDVPSLVVDIARHEPAADFNGDFLNLHFCAYEGLSSLEARTVRATRTPGAAMEALAAEVQHMDEGPTSARINKMHKLLAQAGTPDQGIFPHFKQEIAKYAARRAACARALALVNDIRCERKPLYGRDLRGAVTFEDSVRHVHRIAAGRQWARYSAAHLAAVQSLEQRAAGCGELLEKFLVAIPKVRAAPVALWCPRPRGSRHTALANTLRRVQGLLPAYHRVFHPENIRHCAYFPDKRLVQYDCGKLQELAKLLRKLKAGGHKVLIFTQMSKMLDVLEVFLNLYAYTYLRLDGSTKPDQRQIMMTKFNTDEKIFSFILSTRSGGVGINLTGADTVIFYDSDWNPAMDQQAQDRCHRIGQTREVHIYRLVTEHTIEENIVRKSNQKRHLDHLAIQSAGFDSLAGGGAGGDGADGAGDGAGIHGALSALGGGALSTKLTAKDIRSALQNAEDDTDRKAAAQAEREARQEMAEFSDREEEEEGGEGAPAGPAGGAAEGGAAEGGGAGALEAPAPIDFAKRGEGQVPPMAVLEKLLFPVEQMAVRFFEDLYPATDRELGIKPPDEKPEREEWSLDDMEERRAMIEAGYNPDELVISDAFDAGAAEEYYQSVVQVAEARGIKAP